MITLWLLCDYFTLILFCFIKNIFENILYKVTYKNTLWILKESSSSGHSDYLKNSFTPDCCLLGSIWHNKGGNELSSYCVYDLSYPGRKYHIRVSEPGTKVLLSARVSWKILFLLDGAGKRQLRFAQRPGSWRFPAGGQKNSIQTMASKTESLKSHVCQPRLRLGQQLHVIWDISYFTGLVS